MHGGSKAKGANNASDAYNVRNTAAKAAKAAIADQVPPRQKTIHRLPLTLPHFFLQVVVMVIQSDTLHK